MNKAALKASKLVEKAKSIDEARDNVKDLLKRIEDRIEAEIGLSRCSSLPQWTWPSQRA